MTARARARAEITGEIKATARRHIAEGGATALSLRAVARDLGMVSSALYRYFPSRDALLTALIVDAFDAVGEVAEKADRSASPGDAGDRWRAVGHAVRRWALDNPHEYALVYGSPVPGYVAPPDTIEPATRITTVLMTVLSAIAEESVPRFMPEPPASTAAELAAIAPDLPPAQTALGMAAWAQMFGAISLELFGHLESVVYDRDAFFDHLLTLAIMEVRLAP